MILKNFKDRKKYFYDYLYLQIDTPVIKLLI